jgi:hypothetical protein
MVLVKDPLVWDTVGGDASAGAEEMAADADEAAFGTDPSTPDADGDGYYDGDEVKLGTDPLDVASYPAEEPPPSSA